MLVWRLCRSIYADIKGLGGLKGSARWHLAGNPVVYTSTTLSLCVLERRVHTKFRPKDEVAMQIEVPDTKIEPLEQLPLAWQNDTGYTQRIGTEWLQSKRSLALAVPSALVPETNVLINPLHPDIGTVEILSTNAYQFDPRLFE